MTSLDSGIIITETPQRTPESRSSSQALVVVQPRRLPTGRGVDALRPTLQARLAIARYTVNLRLQELEGRLYSAKEKADPRNWTVTPWVEVGLAALAGYLIGRSRTVTWLSGLVVRAGVKIGLARARAHTSRALPGA